MNFEEINPVWFESLTKRVKKSGAEQIFLNRFKPFLDLIPGLYCRNFLLILGFYVIQKLVSS